MLNYYEISWSSGVGRIEDMRIRSNRSIYRLFQSYKGEGMRVSSLRDDPVLQGITNLVDRARGILARASVLRRCQGNPLKMQ